MSANRLSALVRMLFVGLAATPLILATASHIAGSTPRQTSGEARVQPGLVFDQYLVDLGRDPVAPRPIVYGHFTFRNVSDQPIEITELVPSCGCLQPVLENLNLGAEAFANANKAEPDGLRIFKPGQIGGFTVKVQTANESPGPKDYHVVVKYTDPEPRETLVNFRVVLPKAQLYVRPKAVLIYQLSETPVTQTITVTDSRRKDITIETVETDLDFLQIDVHERTDSESRNEIPISVTVGAVAEGKHQGLIRIKTNDPEFPEIRVPVIVQGGKLP